jgi:hypothetical protein
MSAQVSVKVFQFSLLAYSTRHLPTVGTTTEPQCLSGQCGAIRALGRGPLQSLQGYGWKRSHRETKLLLERDFSIFPLGHLESP